MKALRASLADIAAHFDRRAAIVLTLAALMLLMFKKFGTGDYFRSLPIELVHHPRAEVLADLWWFGSSFVMLGALPALALIRLDGANRGETGLGFGDWRFGLRAVLVLYGLMLPILVIASRAPMFWRYYPLDDQLANQAGGFLRDGTPKDWLIWFLIYEAAYAVYFLGWEYFYRGFLTLGLERTFGYQSILIGNVPFVLMHAGKPLPEALGSIIAGIALGVFAIRTRSFWYCWLLHALIACSMDLLAIERRFALGK